jgi:hypothetical protein
MPEPIDWLNAGSSVLSAVKPSAAGPSSADSVFGTNLGFDNSGWNVSFGNNSPITAPSEKTTSQGGPSGLTGNLKTYLPYVLVFAGALIALKWLKK